MRTNIWLMDSLDLGNFAEAGQSMGILDSPRLKQVGFPFR